jgi:ABC-type nitrate/sulfonate/bicarbonate transport system permease component
MCVTVIAGIVTFFPTLVNLTLALRSTPQASVDLFQAYGANRWVMLRKAQLPSALPALFASLRVAAPLALVGAVLAEFLVTAQGLGYLITTSNSSSQYNQMWAAVALVTMYSIVLYTVISGVERVVLRRFADIPQ